MTNVPGSSRHCPEELIQQLNEISETVSNLTGSLCDLDENKKRWLIIGIALHSVLSPVLRKYVATSLCQIYETLKNTNGIDTQQYPKQLQSYLTARLKYEIINNNKNNWQRQKDRYDYCVKDPVDLSKLFLQTHMAHYSAFDEGCDSSALLGIIIGTSPNAEGSARHVRSEIRNPWAHCNFSNWDETKYTESFNLIDGLVRSLGLTNQEENQIFRQLYRLNRNGKMFIEGTSPEFVVLKEIKTQIKAMMKCIEQSLKVSQEMTATMKRLETGLADSIPKHMEEKYQIHIDDWVKDEEKFTVTRATKHVTGLMEEKDVVVVTGSSGSGKSSLIHHVALKLKKQGYTIIPFVSGPDDIIRYRDLKKNQVFIIDDLCGKNYIDETDLQIWKKQTNTIEKLFPTEQSKEQGKLKILVSCRLQIYKDDKFKSLKIITQVAVDIQSANFCLHSDEKRKMLGKYITNKIPDYRWQEIQEKLEDCHFFPLLCKIAKDKNVEQLTDLFSSPIKCMREDIRDLIQTKHEKMENCALVLCVLFPNGFDEDFIDPRTRPQEVQQKVIDIIDTYEINLANERKRAQLRDTFKRLDGTYVKKTGPIYTISHDKLYDMVAVEVFYEVTELYLNYAPSTLIAEQFRFTSVFPKEEDRLLIYLNDNDENLYFKRCFEDLHKKSYKPIFKNQQLKHNKYRNKVMEYIDQNKESCDELFRRLDKEGMTEERKVVWLSLIEFTCIYTTTPLIEATKADFYQMIEYLIDIKCDLNKQDSYNCSPLWYSCDGGFINIINLLLKHNVKYVDDLVMVCRFSMIDAVKVMVKTGLVDLNRFSTKYEQTPLNAACSRGCSEIALLLLSYNVQYNVDDLVKACAYGMTDVVRVMVERRMVDLTLCGSKTGQTPMNAACMYGHSKIVHLLLSHNVNYDIDDLVEACGHGMTNAVRVMVERGLVDLTLCGSTTDQTPLNAACMYGHSKIVHLLLSHNVNYNVDDLVMACSSGMTDVVKVMVESGLVNLNQSDSETPMFVACSTGHSQIALLLLSRNVKYNVEDLVEACKNGMTNAVAVMVERGLVDLTQRDKYGYTPLNAACSRGHREIALLLLSYNVKYRVDDLVEACRTGMTDVVRVIVKRGLVDLTQCGSKIEQTPLNAACSGGHSEIALLLLNHNVNYNVDDLVEACEHGITDVVKVMIERGLVDLTQCDSETYQTPLNAACERGQSVIALLLLSYNVKYRVDDLVEACRHGMTDVVRVMVERGLVDLGLCGSETDETPLNAACEEGHSKIVRLLLEGGADPSQRDGCRKIALDYTDDETIMNLLKLNTKT